MFIMGCILRICIQLKIFNFTLLARRRHIYYLLIINTSPKLFEESTRLIGYLEYSTKPTQVSSIFKVRLRAKLNENDTQDGRIVAFPVMGLHHCWCNLSIFK